MKTITAAKKRTFLLRESSIDSELPGLNEPNNHLSLMVFTAQRTKSTNKIINLTITDRWHYMHLYRCI